jgi:hypothetical protein
LTTDNVVYFTNYFQPQPKANVVDKILSETVFHYSNVLAEHNVNVEEPDIAFDIATIRYLLQGMAHRSQGGSHPSQTILNSIRQQMLGY